MSLAISLISGLDAVALSAGVWDCSSSRWRTCGVETRPSCSERSYQVASKPSSSKWQRTVGDRQDLSSPATNEVLQWGMNEWCMYIALYCVLLYSQSALQSSGVSPQPPPVCSIHLDDATAATGQRRQCAHHTPATGGEERESKSQSSVCAHHTPATGGEEREL